LHLLGSGNGSRKSTRKQQGKESGHSLWSNFQQQLFASLHAAFCLIPPFGSTQPPWVVQGDLFEHGKQQKYCLQDFSLNRGEEINQNFSVKNFKEAKLRERMRLRGRDKKNNLIPSQNENDVTVHKQYI